VYSIFVWLDLIELFRTARPNPCERICSLDLRIGAGCVEEKSAAKIAQIRTARIGNREKREPQRLIRTKFALCGSVALGPISQNPAKAREFLGPSPNTSLQER